MKNILIKGDNKKALHYLIDEKDLAGKVDLVYIDLRSQQVVNSRKT